MKEMAEIFIEISFRQKKMEKSGWNLTSSNSNAHDLCGIYCQFLFPFGERWRERCMWVVAFLAGNVLMCHILH